MSAWDDATRVPDDEDLKPVRSGGPTTIPGWDHLNDNNQCGPTDDETVCACGCTGYDERCAYYIATYAFTDEQVRPEHRCCQIPGREQMEPMVTQVTEHDDDHEPRVLATAVLRLMAEEVKDCNIEKGWYDVNPRVEKFFEAFRKGFGCEMDEQLMLMVEEHFGPRNFGDDIALLHSEVSEMLEAFRVTGDCRDQTGIDGIHNDYNPKPEGVGSEAADVLVRLLDTCSRYDIDLFAEWRRKVNFNWTRPARHGGKKL